MKAEGWKMMNTGEEQMVAEVGPGNHMGSLFFRTPTGRIQNT